MADELFEHPEKPDLKPNEPFLMPIEDAFDVKGRGAIAVGKVERGTLRRGEEVEIVGLRDENIRTTVIGLDWKLGAPEAGKPAAVLLHGMAREEFERGMVLAHPGSINAYRLIRCNFRRLSASELDTEIINTSLLFSIHFPERFAGQPQIWIHNRGFYCTMTDIQNNPIDWAKLKHNETLEMLVQLEKPIALEPGWSFAVSEDIGRCSNIVGIGTITELI